MEKNFNPSEIESSLYKRCLAQGYFKSRTSHSGQVFSILLPPPNITGTLHMGHGFQQTLMDTLIRYQRMCGKKTHWQLGTDHAGIATQMIIEKQLAQQGKTRRDLGRTNFVDAIWQWKQSSGDKIKKQMYRLGVSADWDKVRFTLDPGPSEAVKKTFIALYQEGLIYRGQRLVNWDPVLQTALSDLEVISTEAKGSLWYIRYPLLEDETVTDKTQAQINFLTIATTRPETLLGDTAVAVHPDDLRYQDLIGKKIALPLCDRKIPIIADRSVDPKFGSGAVKITPAHDFNDYAVSLRHKLPLKNILTLTGKINDSAPSAYRGLDRFEARQKIIDDLNALDLLETIEPHTFKIPRGDRSQSIIEPMLTPQWFIKMDRLAKSAMDVVRSGEIQFVPDNWKNTYFQWLENIEDWCISRQLWWGHRIPAWYDINGNVYVGESEATVRAQSSLDNTVVLSQDEDVLDTWFSSALWPFSALGWPESTEDLQDFYPSSVLITGFDIIFFWVARMIMMGLKFKNQIPFHTVYLTGLIRDRDGQKMSKSKGNVLDPIDLIDGISLEALIKKRIQGMMQPHLAEKIKQATIKEFPNGILGYGTDPLRFTYCALANTGRDIRFDIKRLEGYRNFCNKLWNAARFIMMNITQDVDLISVEKNFSLADRAIFSQLQNLISNCHTHFKQYRFDHLASDLHAFTWSNFCDWYLECAKQSLYHSDSSDSEKNGTRYTALSVLANLLKLLHPIMPFITETLWCTIRVPLQINTTLLLSKYPDPDLAQIDTVSEESFDWVKLVITACRTIRSEMNLNPSTALSLYLSEGTASDKEHFKQSEAYLKKLAKIKKCHWDPSPSQFIATHYVNQLKLAIDLTGHINLQAECTRLEKKISKMNQKIDGLEKRLAYPDFVKKAPPTLVQTTRMQLATLCEQREKYQIQFDHFQDLSEFE